MECKKKVFCHFYNHLSRFWNPLFSRSLWGSATDRFLDLTPSELQFFGIFRKRRFTLVFSVSKNPKKFFLHFFDFPKFCDSGRFRSFFGPTKKHQKLQSKFLEIWLSIFGSDPKKKYKKFSSHLLEETGIKWFLFPLVNAWKIFCAFTTALIRKSKAIFLEILNRSFWRFFGFIRSTTKITQFLLN